MENTGILVEIGDGATLNGIPGSKVKVYYNGKLIRGAKHFEHSVLQTPAIETFKVDVIVLDENHLLELEELAYVFCRYSNLKLSADSLLEMHLEFKASEKVEFVFT